MPDVVKSDRRFGRKSAASPPRQQRGLTDREPGGAEKAWRPLKPVNVRSGKAGEGTYPKRLGGRPAPTSRRSPGKASRRRGPRSSEPMAHPEGFGIRRTAGPGANNLLFANRKDVTTS